MAWTSAAIVVLAASVSFAAVADLPPDAIGSDTVFVIHADAQRLTPGMLRTAANVVLGENAERTNGFISAFQDRYDKATKAGVISVTVIGTSSQRVTDAENQLGVDPNAPPQRQSMNPPVVYYHMKAGGDIKAVEKAMTQDMPEKQRQDVRFEQMDDWVVMHEKLQTPPEKVDGDRARAFADAMATQPDAAIGFVYIPDARTKAQMSKTAVRDGSSKLMTDGLPVLSASKWITLAITLGNDPGIKASVLAADAKSARKLSDAAESDLNDLKDKAANPGQGGGPMALIGPMIAPLLDGFKPVVSEALVTVNLKGQPLNSVANLVATISALRPQQPPKPAAGDKAPAKQ
ncbi:MAG TPA: hypothetical protein VG326_01000 [Tepidisphaeraceae bacterium]|nr:hypothetical protein [Tepidisphaeraceae bacterium]